MPVVANEVTAPDRKAVIFQIDVPLQSLKPGLYLCQVNVIDDVAGSFSFPRFRCSFASKQRNRILKPPSPQHHTRSQAIS